VNKLYTDNNDFFVLYFKKNTFPSHYFKTYQFSGDLPILKSNKILITEKNNRKQKQRRKVTEGRSVLKLFNVHPQR